MTAPDPTAHGVAAVFVTMNRRETAATCLAKLAAQTLRPQAVIVVNNASTDDTMAVLTEIRETGNGWVTVVDLERNLGNAGGIQVAMEKAFSEGFEAVWILDDDSWPEPDALAKLIAMDAPKGAVRSCRVVDLATGALSWPLQIARNGGWSLIESHDPLPEGPKVLIRRSWLGSLIPREVHQAVGPVDGRLFLRGEDEDYPRRIEQAGFPVFMALDSLLHHPPSGHLHRLEFAGRTIILESGLTGDKLYYRLRNSWWMSHRDHGLLRALVTALLHGIVLFRREGPIATWGAVWWEAAQDAYFGRLGMRRSHASSDKSIE